MAQEDWSDIPDVSVEAARRDSEVEDDLEPNDVLRLNEAVVASTDWTAETISRQLDRGNIDLNLIFQRRDARRVKFAEEGNQMAAA